MPQQQTPRPGSLEGMQEVQHWGYENGPVKKTQRAFLIAQARQRVADPVKRADLIRWITNSRTSTAQARQLCKRWGIELPDGTTPAQ
jgi:hypothetical protein